MREFWFVVRNVCFLVWHALWTLHHVTADHTEKAGRHGRLVIERLQYLSATPDRVEAIRYALQAGSLVRLRYAFEELIRDEEEKDYSVKNFLGMQIEVQEVPGVDPDTALIVSPKNLRTLSVVAMKDGKVLGPCDVERTLLREKENHD